MVNREFGAERSEEGLETLGSEIFACFIGIDKFQDPSARWLSGCRRDALAFHALIVDTLPNVRAELLVDERATRGAIMTALSASLGAAGPNDFVILTISTHGTSDHRLVTYDSSLDRCAETTIDMAELANWFKQSKAKVVLCVLDCCFAGGAPARVLESTPITRSPVAPIESIGGVGRLLLAAANVNEPALEKDRHGLLTRALLEALSEEGSDRKSLTAVFDAVMRSVRAQAASMGHVQTPVLVGRVEGGLVLPRLRRGPNFYAAFPETRSLCIDGQMSDLASYGIQEHVLNVWAERYPSGLNELQLSAVNDHRMLDGESLLVVAPTSSGKTFIGELAAAKAIADNRKAVFLFPYRALVNEKFDQFANLYGNTLKMRIIRCTGDYIDDTSAFVKGRYDFAVLTYEMFLNLTVANPATLDVLGLVVVDEVQFISDQDRGIVVELLLTHLLAARERGACPQLIALSAVIGDLNAFDEWLCCQKLIHIERPVPLIEGVVDRTGEFQYVDADGYARRVQLVPQQKIVQRKNKPGKQDVIVPLVHTLLERNPAERIIIFRNKRGVARNCVRYLADSLQMSPARDAIAALPSNDPSASTPELRHCLSNGTAFHTTDLGRSERVVVERAFRQKDGQIKVLAATTTVSAGINTPASTVIIAENEFAGDDNAPYTVADYKNMAGRAGRLGYNEEGRAIMIADTWLEREALFRRYVQGRPEPMRSSFDPEHTETWVLRLLAQVKRVRRKEAARLLASTYGGFIKARQDPGWHSRIIKEMESLLAQMTELDLVDEEDGLVRLTPLGHACGNSSLAFNSTMRLIRILRAQEGTGLMAERVMAFVLALSELDAIYVPLARQESRWEAEATRLYGRSVIRVLQQHVDNESTSRARCKKLVILSDWISGVPLEKIEKRATASSFNEVRAGTIRNIADVTRYHLRSAHKIATALLLRDAPGEEEIEGVLRRLEVGLPMDALDLLKLPVALTRGEYLTLRDAGICSQESFWAQPEAVLSAILSKDTITDVFRHKPH